MEVPNYRPIYGPVTNGLGTGLLGTAAATAITTAPAPYNYSNIPSRSYIYSVDDSSKTIEALKEENEALKNKLDLLEIQFKFLLNKFTELEKFVENSK